MRDVAQVDADGRQGADGARAAGQPLVARDALCHLARAHDLADPASATRTFEIEFDFIDHRLRIDTSDGGSERIALLPHVGGGVLRRSDGAAEAASASTVPSGPMPIEIADAIPFAEDRGHAQYDAARRSVSGGPSSRRTGCSSVSLPLPRQGQPRAFLLGQLRSGGDAVLRPAPHRRILAVSRPTSRTGSSREAYSHEVSSCGFWPGNGGYGRPPSTSMPIRSRPATARRA